MHEAWPVLGVETRVPELETKVLGVEEGVSPCLCLSSSVFRAKIAIAQEVAPRAAASSQIDSFLAQDLK